jgi:glycoside hydrolase-like protein
MEGVDYAWDPPTPAGLVAAGKWFACRYAGAGSPGKWLTRGEADALAAAQIPLVANVEGAANGLLGGYSAGRYWASVADKAFRALGMPASKPVYLSVDFPMTDAQWPAVRAALEGAADVLGPLRVGVYGSYATIGHAVGSGAARWFWQTYAWSGGQWHPAAHIRQYRNHVPLAGGTVDLCRSMTVDFGQWIPGGADMPITATDVQAILNADQVPNPYSDAATNPKITVASALKGAASADAQVRALASRFDAFTKSGIPSQFLAIDNRLDVIEQALAKVIAAPPSPPPAGPTAADIARELIAQLSGHGVV